MRTINNSKSESSTEVQAELVVHQSSVKALKAFPENARTHSKKHILQIAESIKTFGFTNPILVNADQTVIAGHGRLEAAKSLGFECVPTIRLGDLNESQMRAYILADNRLAELAGWDQDILAEEFKYLLEMDLDFDIGVIGFETAEIDLVIQNAIGPDDPDKESIDINLDAPVVTQLGDLWQLNEHQVLCGNALERANFTRLMDQDQARVVFTDPPYNVPINGHVGGSGNIQHSDFQMASGELSEAEFIQFLVTSLGHLTDHCAPGSLLYVCMDWRHLWELTHAGRELGLIPINLCVWNKDNGGMGSMYRSKHELVSVFKAGNASHVNNIQLGKYGRYRTNVWDYPGVNTFRQGRMEELQLHPTVKPIALVEDAILDASHRGDFILDGFGGSGTTLLAAERVGRRSRLLELEPAYVDVTLERWEKATGYSAIHQASGRTFSEMKAIAAEDSCTKSTIRNVDHPKQNQSELSESCHGK